MIVGAIAALSVFAHCVSVGCDGGNDGSAEDTSAPFLETASALAERRGGLSFLRFSEPSALEHAPVASDVTGANLCEDGSSSQTAQTAQRMCSWLYHTGYCTGGTMVEPPVLRYTSHSFIHSFTRARHGQQRDRSQRVPYVAVRDRYTSPPTTVNELLSRVFYPLAPLPGQGLGASILHDCYTL